jgi:WhiB family redox-sensing transcriptional regulator
MLRQQQPHERDINMTTAITTKTGFRLNPMDCRTPNAPIDPTISDKDLPMSTFAPINEIDELDPDITSPPDIPAVRAPVARCADGNGTMVGLFFSDHVVDIARAKAMCGLCKLSTECLADALERDEPWGVWGGELLSGGRVIADKRPCGRPKEPAP